MTMMQFNEFAPNHGYQSMFDCVSENEYENKSVVLNYLMNNGHEFASAAGFIRDKITKDRTNIPLVLLGDGEYSWSNELPYYVENYNLRLPKNVEDYILSKQS